MNQSFFDTHEKFENLLVAGPVNPLLATSDGGIYMAIFLESKAY